MSLEDALAKAESLGLDLVQISSTATPPVCKVIDYSKFKYQLQKRAHLLKVNNKQLQLKEIKLRPVTDKHDYDIKLKRAKKFLDIGHKVKFIVHFRGRELAHQYEHGMQIIKNIINDMTEFGTSDTNGKVSGRNVFVCISPHKKK